MRVRVRKAQAAAGADRVPADRVPADECRDTPAAAGGLACAGGAADDRASELLSELARLSRLTAPFSGSAAAGPTGTVVPSGFRGLDRLLPAGGIGRGSLVEWIGGPASGAAALAFAVACRLVASRRAESGGRHSGGGRGSTPAPGGTIVVVDRRGRFHPPAVLPWVEVAQGGRSPAVPCPARDAPLGALVVARPGRDEDEIWAIDQALRCPGVTAVVAWPGRATSTALRRWQLAARSGGAVGLLVRPVCARGEPSWAQARLDVTASRVADAGGTGSPRASAAAVGARPAGAAEDGTLVRLVPSLAVRRLCVTLVEGPWTCAAPPDARHVEIDLDLATGREAFANERPMFAAGRETLADRPAVPGAGDGADGGRAGRAGGRVTRSDGRAQPGGVSCRAS